MTTDEPALPPFHADRDLPPPPRYAPLPGYLAPVEDRPNRGKAITGFVCGLVGILFAWPLTFWMAFILGTLGIVFGALGRRYALGKWGLALGIVAVALSVVMLIVLIAIVNHAVDTTPTDFNSFCTTYPDLCSTPGA